MSQNEPQKELAKCLLGCPNAKVQSRKSQISRHQTEMPTMPFKPPNFFPQVEVYPLELVLGGGGESEDAVVGDKLPKLIAGVVSLKGDLGDRIGAMGGNAAILGSEMTDGLEALLVLVIAGEGGTMDGSGSCDRPVQCKLGRPP